MSETIGTCQNCGLCCEHLLVEANALDVLREPRIETANPLRKARQLSVLDACWIIAGPGRPCTFLTRDKHCSIYPTRPNACVAFAPGSQKCQELRRAHGLPPTVPQPSVHHMLTQIMKAVIEAEVEDPDL